VEQAVYVAGLSSLHPDGSLRAVLVQFQVQSLSTPQQAMLSLGGARSDAMTLSAPLFTPGTSVPSAPNGLPQAAALPDDPNYLIATDLVGGTISSAATAALGGVFARYESDFVKFGGTLWRSEGANWGGDYYDRALIYYAMWVRTGDPTYWERAGQIAYDYRAKYLEANNFVSSPHWAQLEGLEKHYLMTGDDKSRFAVARVANVMNGYINTTYMSRAGGDSRIAARVLHSQLLAWRLTPPGQTLAGNSAATYGAHLEAALANITAWQQPDGSFPEDGVTCGGQLNYMVGLQNDALIKTYAYYAPATTSQSALRTQIQTIVQKAVDYIWSTQWLPANSAFKYASVQCANGGPTAAPDLNNLIATGFGWLYKRTGNAQYLTNGDAIFAGGVTQAWLNGTKQFNEEYSASFRYLGYR
jgi:hypothetical protein